MGLHSLVLPSTSRCTNHTVQAISVTGILNFNGNLFTCWCMRLVRKDTHTKTCRSVTLTLDAAWQDEVSQVHMTMRLLTYWFAPLWPGVGDVRGPRPGDFKAV